MRGFDIRGVGPRVIRYAATYDPLNPVIDTSNDNRGQIDDALGGRAYYQGRIELDIPLGTGAKELGLRFARHHAVGAELVVHNAAIDTRHGRDLARRPARRSDVVGDRKSTRLNSSH